MDNGKLGENNKLLSLHPPPPDTHAHKAVGSSSLPKRFPEGQQTNFGWKDTLIPP
jgi:hypothetical protein